MTNELNGLQSYAKDLSDYFKQIYAGGCLAMCIIYICTNGNATKMEMFGYLIDMLRGGELLGRDCYVKDVKELTGAINRERSPYRIEHTYKWLKINDLKEVGNEFTLLKYKAASTREGHWVVARNGEIVFNGLDNSINVNEGKIVEARQLV